PRLLLTRHKLKIRSRQQSESHENISRFPKRNAPKQPTQNTAGRKQGVRRTWIPTTSVVTAFSAVPMGRGFRSEYPRARIRHHPAGAKASRRPLCVSIAIGSRRSKTQKLFRFGHFGIPFL